MKINCPNPYCVLKHPKSPKIKSIVRNGSSFRKSDSRFIQRYYCRLCGRFFSRATFDPRFGQRKRRLNSAIDRYLCSGVSQRRAAKLLGIDPKTVARKLRFLGAQARAENEKDLVPFKSCKLKSVQFDDLETSEHTKCKPLSVSLAVAPRSRKILGFSVSQMPAKGLLVKIAKRKYPHRPDHRSRGWGELFYGLQRFVAPEATFLSDENPHYPKFVAHYFPNAKHETTPGGRGAIVGQGELKKLKFDPLFSLNHTCAMLRANLNRLFRRTWCTTKKVHGLIDHLAIYVRYHNRCLTKFSDA